MAKHPSPYRPRGEARSVLGRRLGGLGAALVLCVTFATAPAAAHNPDLVPPNPGIITGPIIAALNNAVGAANTFVGVANSNLQSAATALAALQIPIDEMTNITQAAEAAALVVIGAAQVITVASLKASTTVMARYINETGHVAFHAQEFGNSAFFSAVNITKAVLVAFCQQPLEPPPDPHFEIEPGPNPFPDDLPEVLHCAEGSILHEAHQGANQVYRALVAVIDQVNIKPPPL